MPCVMPWKQFVEEVCSMYQNDPFEMELIPRGAPVEGMHYDMTYHNIDYVSYKIQQWKMSSPQRKWQIIGERYFRGYHDILKKKRMTINAEDEMIPLHKLLPNNKFIDNQYAKMVQQKVNYIFSKPFQFQTSNSKYQEELEKIFDQEFMRTLKMLGEQSINCGVGWLHPYYDMKGELRFKVFNSWEICPIWADDTETTLAFAIRIYPFKIFQNNAEVIIDRVEVYTPDGIEYYILENSKLIPDNKKAYITVRTTYDSYPMNWGGQIPLIPFKSNSRSIPLITCCKSLQDGINQVMSVFGDLLMENMDSSLLVVKGFVGDDKEKDALRFNFLMKRTLFINNDDTEKGGVDTLRLEVDHTNYEYIITLLRERLIEACRGYNIYDKRFSASSANEMNVKTAFNDMDLDTNGIELEFQHSFRQLLYFINKYLQSKGKGNYDLEEVTITFRRDTVMNVETMLQTLSGLGLELPQKLMYDQVPWIEDTEEALKLLKKDREERVQMAQKMKEATQSESSPTTTLSKKQLNQMNDEQREVR